jgi:hypothetical protein
MKPGMSPALFLVSTVMSSPFRQGAHLLTWPLTGWSSEI